MTSNLTKSLFNWTECQQKARNNSEDWIDDATWILTSAFIIFTMRSGKENSFVPIVYYLSYQVTLNYCFCTSCHKSDILNSTI